MKLNTNRYNTGQFVFPKIEYRSVSVDIGRKISRTFKIKIFPCLRT
jgi:hypothetical protein